jgi:dTDP-4-dehydrorhamnose reductase
LRVLITGAGGMLGRELVAAFASARVGGGSGGHEVVAADHARLDVGDRDAVLATICSAEPDTVVHTGAWTAVDACEGDPAKAFAVNALGTRFVADAARQVGARVVYLSTDYVFDGEKETPYHEWDVPRPRSVYGASKLGGEHEVAAIAHDWAIVRTAWVCGRHGANMVKTILRLSDSHPQLAFVDDQRGSPTIAADLAVAVRRLVVGRFAGVFHVTNQGSVSWHGFARAVLAASGADPDRVRPIRTADLDPPRPAPRPATSVLDNVALRASGLPSLPPWEESLGALVRELTAVDRR